jgi:hypothetical protein
MHSPSAPPRLVSARKLRTLRESHTYRRELDAISSDVARMDEVLDGVTGVVASNPLSGKKTDREDIYAITASNWEAGGKLVIYYSLPDEDHVVLESILREDNDEE